MACNRIPLSDDRRGELKDWVRGQLGTEPIDVQTLYSSALAHFGDERCLPDVMCPSNPAPDPEYQHLIRRVLQDIREEIENGPNGHWKLISAE
ncbi:MAG: hypothetical protein P1U42_06585 [Phycisphaerales bacterium]|nr:hypothetical protein [Phycisphaerales bacterium]